jgi:hypothetical protein
VDVVPLEFHSSERAGNGAGTAGNRAGNGLISFTTKNEAPGETGERVLKEASVP